MMQPDTIGVIRDHRWIKAAEQRKRLEAEKCRAIIEIGPKDVSQADFMRLATEGRTFVLAHAFLLADPLRRNQRGGLKASFNKTLATLEAKGSHVKDLETGLTTETKEHRRAIIALSHNHISRSNQGLRSNINGAKSKGRPPAWSDPKVRKVLWDEWHSTVHKTNAEAVAAAEARLGRKVWQATMYRVIKEMRREKGKPAASGASGRLPGNPAMRANAYRKARRVYFMLCNGKVKIGVATKVNGRLSAMQTGNPDEVKLLACTPGDEELEGKLHKRFKRLHVRGEWFKYEGSLKDYIQSLPKCRAK